MTNEEIVKKAVEVAKKNGWDMPDANVEVVWDENMKEMARYAVSGAFFSHSFAEAFCKYIIKTNQINKLFDVACKLIETERRYRSEQLYVIRNRFLERLAVSRDRLKYIEKFLRKGD